MCHYLPLRYYPSPGQLNKKYCTTLAHLGILLFLAYLHAITTE